MFCIVGENTISACVPTVELPALRFSLKSLLLTDHVVEPLSHLAFQSQVAAFELIQSNNFSLFWRFSTVSKGKPNKFSSEASSVISALRMCLSVSRTRRRDRLVCRSSAVSSETLPSYRLLYEL